MKLMISDYRDKLYNRSTIKCGDHETSNFILSSVTYHDRELFTLEGYHDPSNYKILLQESQNQIHIFEGLLYDTEETQWETDFIDNYKNRWKASLCMRNHLMVELKYLNVIMKGYLLSLSVSSNNSGISNFKFDFFPIVKMMTGGPSVITKTWPKINLVQRSDPKAMIYRTNLLNDVKSDDSEEFVLSGVQKSFRERYQITGPEDSIITFGSHPITYNFNLQLIKTPNDSDNQYSWDEKFRIMLKEKWSMNSLSGNNVIGISYKNRVALGYIIDPVESLRSDMNASELGFSFIVVDDKGVISSEDGEE
jgi:hypothetical protein